MKKLGSLLLLLSCLSARADGVSLAAGDFFVYTFNSLPYAQPASGGDPFCRVGMTFTTDKMFAGEALKLEMFEDTIADTPFSTNVFMGVGSPPFGLVGASSTIFSPVPPWQDLQGTIRLTMLTGSVTIGQLDFTTQIGSDLYSATFPVPEPAVPILLALSMWSLGWKRRREAKRKQEATLRASANQEPALSKAMF